MPFKPLAIAAGLTLITVASAAMAADECALPPDAVAGKQVSNQCKTCHVLEADKPSRTSGPNLHDVFGGAPGGRKDFVYSDGIQAIAAKGVLWNDATLFDYLADPKGYLTKTAGTDVHAKMGYALKDEERRRNVIAFLKAIAGKPECN